MKKTRIFLRSTLKLIGVEGLIIFALIFTFNNYIGNVKKTISADGEGYYDYLPSLFIHHDLIRNDIPFSKDSVFYSRLANPPYVLYGDFKVNKYPCGTAVLQLPFFMYSYFTTLRENNSTDGYQFPFQKAIFYSAIFYLFLSLYFLKKLLELFEIKRHVIVISQTLLVFGTTVTHYVNFDAGFSHVYSLFAITAFIYFAKLYFTNKKASSFFMACLFIGLILIIRQINILIILFIPFLSGSFENLKDGLHVFYKDYKNLILGLLITAIIFSVQCLVWYFQTGSLLVYSYQGEGFNFSNPQILNILFSYQKGLFIYTPILFISMFGLVWLIFKKKYYLVFTWVLFFSILTFVFSSWHSWYYGCSFGLRAYVDYYSIFFVLFAVMLNDVSIGIKSIVLLLSTLTIPLNIIQTYQYKEFILHWSDMNKEKYWNVFLKTSDIYKGLIWKKNYDFNNYFLLKEIVVGNIKGSFNNPGSICKIESKDIPEFEKVSIIQVLINDEYMELDNSKIVVSIDGSKENRNYYWHNPNLMQFSEKGLSTTQTGLYNYEFAPIADMKEKTIFVEVQFGNVNNTLEGVRLKFFRRR